MASMTVLAALRIRLDSGEIWATFQRDNLRRHFSVRIRPPQPRSRVSVGYVQLCARGAVSAADHPPLLSHTKSFFVMCITSRPQLWHYSHTTILIGVEVL